MNDKILFAGKAKDVRPFFEQKSEEIETIEDLSEECPEFPKFEYYFDDPSPTAQELIDEDWEDC
jgi:hypothetical protein